MELQLFQVDAFATHVFTGNPAAVCPLDSWLPDTVMQKIAEENNLSETVFFVKNENGYHIRWFTPTIEVDLCGHATLASAYVIFEHLNYDQDEIHFESLSGPLSVKRCEFGYQLNFPKQAPVDCPIPDAAMAAFGRQPIQCLKHQDYIFVFDDEEFVKSVKPDMNVLKQLDMRGVVITCASEQYDFVSRCFAPNYGIDEDPVTGATFTQLTPMWQDKLNKTSLNAKQVSARGGEVHCQLDNDRVLISGKAVLFMKGSIYVR